MSALALLRPALFPLTALLACWLLWPGVTDWGQEYEFLLLISPLLIAALCLVLAQVFNQGRIGQMIILVVATYGLIQWQMQSTLDHPATWWMYFWLTLLFPLNAMLIRYLPERRPLSLYGLMFPATLALQAVFILGLPGQLLTTPLGQWVLTFQRQPGDVLIPLPAWISFAVSLGLVINRLPRNADVPLAFAAVIILHGLMFYHFDQPYMSALTAVTVLLLLFTTLLVTNHQLAFIDELTALPGRRALMNDLKHRHGHYILVMADIDHFKQFNDTHGHDTGDDVLRLVASQLGKTTGGGRAYRYGGEEFTLIFPSASLKECRPFIEATRARIASYPLVVRNTSQRPEDHKSGKKQRGKAADKKTLSVTMSFGAARRQSGETIEALLKRADKALYKAKQNGRNRVEDAV